MPGAHPPQRARHTSRGTALILALLLTGCTAKTGDESQGGTEGASSPESTFEPGSKEETHACVKDALGQSQTGTAKCGEHRLVVCNENGTFRLKEGSGHFKVVCKAGEFVGTTWDTGARHSYRRVRYLGHWVGRAVPVGRGTRLARPGGSHHQVPQPAPDASPDELVYSTDNDHGYTGPRCYEPGGYYFHPC
jgi:hypothetical protein